MFLMNESKLIGAILKHYRKRSKYTRENINGISKDFGKELSLSTIKRIENYECISSPRNIDAYCHLFGLHYCDNKSLYNELDSFSSSILDLIKNGSKITTLEQLHDKLLNFNKTNKEYIFASEISKLMIDVLNIYLYNTYDFDQDKLTLFDDILNDIDNKNIKLITYYYLYKTRASFKTGNTQENLNYTAKYIKVNFTTVFYFERIVFLFEDNLLEFYNSSKAIYDNLKETCQNNKVYYFSTTSDLAFCELNLKDYNNAKKHLLEIININNINEYIPENIYLDNIIRLGIVNYHLKEYEKAYSNLLEVRNKDAALLGLNYCLLFKSAEMIGKANAILKIINKDYNDMKLIMAKNIFTYYKLKYSNESLEKQEKYICTFLNKKDIFFSLYFDLFTEELKKLVDQTKHYQLYYMYVNQE